MSFNPIGSNPVFKVFFGGIDFGKCTIFIKEPNSLFRNILSFDNQNMNSFSFEIDLNRVLNSSKVSILKNCQVGWTVTFIDMDNTTPSQFSFDLEINQDGQSLTKFSKVGSIEDTSTTFGEKFTF
jgi:hypothetical protein